ncbi:MAG: T9SS type A sorting domain-containing protein [Alphaproteobacteria bacterium]|nr:T9SS type A sorting domain-containing protein [Alphaproteobacteria bacterium]
MKKFYLLFSILWIVVAGFSQSQRFILFEEFTNASCSPCAAQNPGFDALLNANASKCTSIKYHTNWPGTDPMNAQNPADVGTRVTYYNVNGVPHALMDGVPQTGSSYLGAPANVTQGKIDARYAIQSPFSMQMQHLLSTAQDSVYSTMLITCTEGIAENLVAHNVIIEKWIHFNNSPGSNGEKDFYNVMKKMLPGANGTSLPSQMEAGDYVILEGAWKFANVYDKTQIAAVGFVQNKVSKEVHQAALSATSPLTLPYDLDAQVMEVIDVLPKTCIGKLTPSIRIRNNGNSMLQNLTFKYRVNDGPEQSYTWIGGLESLKKTVVVLPEYSFAIREQNELLVYSTMPNTGTDQYPKNDTLHFTFTNAPVSTNQVKVVIRTDNAPEQTTWAFKNSLGETVAFGGPYTQPNKIHQQTITLPKPDCYRFTLYDSGGDGICCTNGNGVYELSSSGTIIKQGGQFGYYESSDMWYEAPVSVTESEAAGRFTVRPNPMNNTSKVSFYLPNDAPVSLQLYSSLGQPVLNLFNGALQAGKHELTLEGNDLKSGIYILRLNTGTNVYSRKVTVVK